ncbi:LytTR family DNA-binding domain-containing protein [Marixanthomonas ophiurae]|uniref:LytTR family transcriptional regulator n=1 Tax=Marixanthomonas ophiurae TaxID=387659 RepID=A0A3E1Q830_9FLAO|nr:LytTR family DNA-binding domain-containing protein [Marixanthomonas ophiurae]RFN58278.1 LytTR family transcriptional regulator [Marixanthomonas ophiurae]
MLNTTYPFDPFMKHHLLVALGLVIWIFTFLYLTEPLDVNELTNIEQLIYLPIYGLVGGIAYFFMMPFQNWLCKNTTWTIGKELLFILCFSMLAFIIARGVYLYIIVSGEPNPYGVWYFFSSIYLPVIAVILPIVIGGRLALGKYREKSLEDQKIKIDGEGTYEGLHVQLNDIISIKADDNYIEVVFLDFGNVKRQLIRNKLSYIETLDTSLIRSHRSHIFNPFHFKQWKNKKGKLALLLSNDIEIPVSKTYVEHVKSVLES